jgi:hypothetical protein
MSVERAKLPRGFEFVRKDRQTISYPAGFEGPMPKEQYDRAVSLGFVEGVEAKVDPKAATAAELEKAYDKGELSDIATAAGVTDLSGTKADIAERIVAARS